jgi:hypothetical protein
MASSRPTITSHRAQMPERFWIPVRTYAFDGGARPNCGGTPFRQPCPAYPSTIGRKAPQERFSEESFRTRTSSGNEFLKSSAASLRQHGSKTHSTQQAWMYSRNQTTIASARKHRQPVFLHPTHRTIGIRLARARIAQRLLIPLPASTLQVFQFIRRLVLRDFGTQSHSNV